MLVYNNSYTLHTVPKCIKIRTDVPLPPARPYMTRYAFIQTLDVGESFEVNGDTPGYKAKSLAPAAYQVASFVRKTTNKKFKIACRTLEGTSKNPIRTAVWRIA
jgi:hypothetical protein|tara:strand:+ start:70 stop:381 length:312 start_codon:yes stop_codon:yes gene_type:complete